VLHFGVGWLVEDGKIGIGSGREGEKLQRAGRGLCENARMRGCTACAFLQGCNKWKLKCKRRDTGCTNVINSVD
jgi:hypothetical protein